MARAPRRGSEATAVQNLQDAGFAPAAVDPAAEATYTGGNIDPNTPVLTNTASTASVRSSGERAKPGGPIRLRGFVTEPPTEPREIGSSLASNIMMQAHEIDRDGNPLGDPRDWDITLWRADALDAQNHLRTGDEVVVNGKWAEPRRVTRSITVDNEVSAYGIYHPLGAQMAPRGAQQEIVRGSVADGFAA